MNKRILILSGPTHEYIDPVRYIGNASSGLMGKAIAEEAATRGYSVAFVTGPVADSSLPDLGDDNRIRRVVSAAEMLETAASLFKTADIIVFAAAVADYTPVERSREKRPKSGEMILHLTATADIAQTLCMNRRADQIAIGFALQTTDGEVHARRKCATKQLDGIVLNTPATLGAENGTFSFLSRGADAFLAWGTIDKTACARRILDAVQQMS